MLELRKVQSMEIVIETKRLLLRQFAEEDAEALCAVCNQDDILRWMPDWKGTVEQKREWIRWVDGQYANANRDTARVILTVTLPIYHSVAAGASSEKMKWHRFPVMHVVGRRNTISRLLPSTTA